MKIKRFGAVVALAVTGSLVLASCSNDTETPTEPGTELSGTINGVGASSMNVGQTNWKAGFETLHEQVTVNYDPQGSGNGRKAFLEGAADFAGSDDALKLDAIGGNALCVDNTNAINLPLWISPIAVIFNLDGVSNLNLDAQTIADIFSGKITKWNDAAIASQNEGTTLPDLTITRVVRSDSSGTTSNFTDYLDKASAGSWEAGRFGVWPDDLAATAEKAEGTSGVVSAVTAGQGTIGYADASRAGSLGTVSVKVGDSYVAYTPEAAAAVVGASPLEQGRASNDLAIDLKRDTTEEGQYPIVLVAYTIACEDYKDDAKAELVREYLSYVASDEAQKIAAEQGGIAPISGEIAQKVRAAIAGIK